jgi:tRNA-specific 2-thiouridylase
VYRIDIEHNILYVTDKDNEQLQTKTLIAKNWHRINPKHMLQMSSPDQGRCPKGGGVSGKIRYRQNPPVDCTLEEIEDGKMKVTFDEAQRAVAPGQVFVAYDGEVCLGCGIIE